MSIREYLKTAIIALRLNVLRSVLTTLGIIIGVASVIVMSAIGSGAQQADRRPDQQPRHQPADHLPRIGQRGRHAAAASVRRRRSPRRTCARCAMASPA